MSNTPRTDALERRINDQIELIDGHWTHELLHELIDDAIENGRKLETELSAKDAEIAALKKTSEMLSTNWTNTERLLAQARRAIGDHAAPADCYSTGPLTGDPIRDLVECPACTFIAADAARAEQGGKT